MKNQFEIGKNQRSTTIRRVAVAGSVLLIVAAAWMTIDRLISGGPISLHSQRSRAGWYARSGQWQADVRTLAAAVEYVMTPERDFEPRSLPIGAGPIATVAATTPKASLPSKAPRAAQGVRIDF